MKLKDFFILLLLLSDRAHCDTRAKLLNYTVEIILDWNSKHVNDHQNDVAIINIDKDQTFANQLALKIASTNPLLVLDLTSCDAYKKTRKAGFVIGIVEESTDVVSF